MSEDYKDYLEHARQLIFNGYPVGDLDVYELAKKLAENAKFINSEDKEE